MKKLGFSRLAVVSLFAVGLSVPVHAHAGGCGCVPISLPVGDQYKAHIPGQMRLGYSFMFSDTDHYFIGTERQDGPGETEETVAPSTLGRDNTLSVEYDLPRKFTIGMAIPFIHTEQAREFGGVRGSMEAGGLGDVRVFGRYWLKDNPVGFGLYTSLGARLPTGESDKQFEAQNGSMVNQDLAAQAGTGNFAGLVEIGGATFFAQRFGFSFTSRYVFTPSETSGPNFRNQLTGNGPAENSDADTFTTRLGISTPLATEESPLQRVAVHANFDLAWIPDDDLFGGSEGFRRAGTILALGPGVSYSPLDPLTLSAAVPFTLYRDVRLNGGNVQDWTVQFGLSWNAYTPSPF